MQRCKPEAMSPATWLNAAADDNASEMSLLESGAAHGYPLGGERGGEMVPDVDSVLLPPGDRGDGCMDEEIGVAFAQVS